MSNFPEEARKQLKSSISKMTDESLNLVANLLGIRYSKKDRIRLKRETEAEVGAKIEEAISRGYQVAVKLARDLQTEDSDVAIEQFYLITDTIFKAVFPDIPEEMHAMDYFIDLGEELSDFRFTFPFLEDTRYLEYLQSLQSLGDMLTDKDKISEAFKVIYEFKESKDAFPLLQSTFQRLIDYYEFLSDDSVVVEKKKLDKYLEIYGELSGQYEKFIALVAVMLAMVRENADHSYENARKRRLYNNIRYIEKRGWKSLTSGFNRNLRNAIAHKTYKVDIVRETVEFHDVSKAITLTFGEVQRETRELGALLLLLPHIFISVFRSAVLSVREKS
jgi:hypothetical protein